MQANPSLLKQLKDIHMPKAIGIWPLAPGWWIVIGIVMLILIATIYFILKRRGKITAKKLALQQLYALEEEYSADTNTNLLSDLAILLRRAAIAYYPRSNIAKLHGEKWLAFLDETSKSKRYTQGVGRALLHGPYAASYEDDLTPIFSLVKSWIKRLH